MLKKMAEVFEQDFSHFLDVYNIEFDKDITYN